VIKILAVILAALMVLGVHLVFEIGCAATVIAAFAVAGRVMETGMRCVPRCVVRVA
jgi:hypothetical protein